MAAHWNRSRDARLILGKWMHDEKATERIKRSDDMRRSVKTCRNTVQVRRTSVKLHGHA